MHFGLCLAACAACAQTSTVRCCEALDVLWLTAAFVGSRAAKICLANSTYYKAVDACIPQETSATSSFRNAFALKKRCAGGSVETTEQLEVLLFCEIIEGGLTISVSNASADFSSLRYISHIQGL
jgi:hypothetical protein